MPTTLPPPLSGPPPGEVPLPHAPLVRVIAQIRFPPILAIRNPDKVASFQETIRPIYPILEEERVRHIVLAAAGEPDVKEGLLWRFRDRERKWRVSLGTDFLALETTAYQSRKDFLERLSAVVSGVEMSLNPQEAQRLGIRYIDRLTGDAVANIRQLVRQEVLGVALASIGQVAQHILTDTLFPTEEAQIRARWGHLPPTGTIDPEALEPVAEPSWILDLDMFTPQPQAFTTENLLETATRYAERIYTVFRWMVTEEFLRFYGGEP